MAKANINKMNNPYFERWKSMFNDLVYKCSLMCTLENECLEAPIRIPDQVWEDTDSLQSNIMSMSMGEVIDAIDKIYKGLYGARYGEYSASTKKSKIMKETMIPEVVRILEKHYGVTTMSQWGIYEYIRRYENESPEEIAYRIYDDLYNFDKSTKKSKQPSINDISFEANVNSLRKTNYAKCGNINTTIRERK